MLTWTGERLESFSDALVSVERGLAAVYADDVSLFGAMGSRRTGWAEVRRTLPLVASRYRGGSVRYQYDVVHEGTDVAYAVGFERGEASIDGGPAASTTIRFTHVFRREAGAWRLAHRHGDFVST